MWYLIPPFVVSLTQDKARNPALQLAPFIDIGTIWNTDRNPTLLPDQAFLASIG